LQRGRSKSQRYSKGEKDIVRGRESKRYDIGKGSIKIEHTSRVSKLMNYFVAFVCALT
jgi:hypothetical protein